MSATSLSMAATATCSTSLHLSNKISSNLSFECPLLPIPTSKPKPKPKLALKIKTQFFNSPHFSLLSRSFAVRAFENIGVAEEPQNTDSSETDSEEFQESEDDDDDEKSKKQSAEAGRLYVGNLPYSMTSSQLSEIFTEAGSVVSVEIVYDRVTDRSRGFAFVTMASVEEAKEAIRLFDGSQIGGRTVKVNFPEVPKGGEREVMAPRIRSSYQGFIDSPHKIYAGNLSWGLSSQGLREAFADQPGLLSAKVIYDRDTGRSRGFGFITFSSAEDVQSALNTMNEAEVEGRPLRLNLAAERTPSTTPPSLESNPEGNLDSSEMLTGISS
ncbi:33 kDa ribonucleoprotein, chloroplastic [Cornus florida]|uniref:33 kDa ribonucleoprotein, chloroplastic n=1 Tax=Cornus florida TaxID=4283 RepID=UPI00289D6DD9|nr:33 kDa ribonucleoprotein, chloroplastic [Cornus florida]